MPSLLKTSPAGSESKALNEIRACHVETMSFFNGVFDQLESLYGSLLAREQHVVKQADVGEDNVSAADAAEKNRWDMLRQEFAEDREELRHAQQAVGQKIDRLSAVADDLAAARNEFQTVRGDLARHNEELTAVRTQMQAAAQEVEISIKNKILDLDRQQSLLEKDRALMETGLESVGSRAAEMAELLGEHKRLAAAQQGNWAEELQQIRLMLDVLARHTEEHMRQTEEDKLQVLQEKRQAGEEKRQSEPSPAAKPPAGVAGVALSDPVLESVLAQFEILQQDRHSRRSDSSESVKNNTQ